MSRAFAVLVVIGLPVAAAIGQPKEWSDDFTTVATYDSNSLAAPCSGGAQPKYTIFEVLLGDVYNERALSGNGRMLSTNRTGVVPTMPARVEFLTPGWLGLGQGCPGEPPLLRSTEEFTSDDICIYGAYMFSPWDLRGPSAGEPNQWKLYGPDGKWGVADVDDDLDGTTDELNEGLAARPTTVNNGYGNRNGTGFAAGVDGKPGAASVDDDGNGTMDDLGETGWPGTDDGDDLVQNVYWYMLNADFAETSAVYLSIDLGWGDRAKFNLKHSLYLSDIGIQSCNELGSSYYQPYKTYNFVFCASGTCYGALLWAGTDLANPDETLGPCVNSQHTDSTACYVSLSFLHNQAAPQYLRRMMCLGNQNFSDTFWVVSGNPAQYYPSPSADLDADKDVDGFDFLTFSNCYNGSNKPPLTACTNARADLDRDGDVDGFDFLTFSNCYNGSNRKPLAACFPPNLTTCGS